MSKQYISILSLLPYIMENAGREFNRGVFKTETSYSRGFHQYLVEAQETNNTLTFVERQRYYKNLDKRTRPEDESHYRYNDYPGEFDIQSHAPYMIGRAYEAPFILELEYLKTSTHMSYLTEELISYIENMYYQYVLFYIRLKDPRSTSDITQSPATSKDNIIYTTLEDKIIELNDEAEDFSDQVKTIIFENYDTLQDSKALKVGEKRAMVHHLFPARNLDDLFAYRDAYDKESRYSYGVDRLIILSQYTPILLLMISISQDKNIYSGLTYSDYKRFISGFVTDRYSSRISDSDVTIKTMQEIPSIKTLAENQEHNSYGEKIPVFAYMNSSIPGNALYTVDTELNSYLYPHIFNELRKALFGNGPIVVSYDDLGHYRDQLWASLTEPVIILNATTLDWSE